MAPRKPQPAAPPVTLSNPARVTKTKAKKTGGTTTKTTRATEPTGTYRVKRYRNGILNLEKTPAHLVAIVKRNASESPLLRLPAELRNQIWSLAMGGKLVRLPYIKGATGSAVRIKVAQLNTCKKIEYVKLPAAFHLPEVCRQVYSETALTSYQQNTFIYALHHLSATNSMTRLIIAQRRAITNIKISVNALYGHLLGFHGRPITNKLPNLKTILVPRSALTYTIDTMKGRNPFPSSRYWSEDQWKLSIGQKLQQQEGVSLEVRFEEDHNIGNGTASAV